MELTELIKDYIATELLSSIELDFLEGELWETTQHIAEINTVFKALKNICEELGLDEKSCWQIFYAAVLDSSWPLKSGQKRVEVLKNLLINMKLAIRKGTEYLMKRLLITPLFKRFKNSAFFL